ncbi:MAG TPA: SDR family NAD(P)-dependent oxidoreductase [Anaerolineales bacterium]|nr:SDR family NAD(P)-dependent oxidoreductase [Anaerolineales bacterium]
MNQTLHNKVALITGGTSGIGRATALLFAQAGAKVAITGRRAPLGEQVAAEIAATGGQALFLACDHRALSDCQQVVETTAQVFGGIDILFNNAGIVTSGTAESTSEETWHTTLDLNVTTVWRMSRLVLPHLRARGGGAIVNNASDWGLVGAANALAYCTSKGALIQLTRAMALDHAHENIRINAVCPGDTFVERWAEKGYGSGEGALTLEQANATYGRELPLGRVAHPEEIAQAVLFLASPAASYITGSALAVDGGNTAR